MGNVTLPSMSDREPVTGQSYTRGFAWTVFTSLITKGLVPIAGLLIARELSPEVMGVYFVLQTILTLSDAFRDAGLTLGYLNDQNLTPGRERTYHAIGATIGFVLAGILAALAIPLSQGLNLPDLSWSLVWTSVGVLFASLATVPLAKLFREGRFKEAGMADAIATTSTYAVALALVYAGMGLEALVGQLVARGVLLYLIANRWAPCGVRGWDRSALQPILRVSASLTGGNLLSTLYLLTDQFMVPKLFGPTVNGFYGIAKWLTSRPAEFVAGPLVKTAQVAFGRKSADLSTLGGAMFKGMTAFLIVVAPIQAMLAILAEPIVLALLGHKYESSIPFMAVLSLYSATRVFGPFAGSALVAAGRTHAPFLTWVLGWLVVGGVLIAEAGRYEPLRLAWIFTAGLVAVNLITLIWAVRVLPPGRAGWGKIGRATLAVLTSSAALVGVAGLDLGAWPTFLLGTFVMGIVHWAAVGLLLAGHPFALRSPSRLRALIREL